MQNETATTVGHWSWDPDLKRLRIDPDRSAALDDISGSWSLNALGVLLDGFSRSRLERALDPASGARRDIACAVGLSSGGAIRLVGRFDAAPLATSSAMIRLLMAASSLRPGRGWMPRFSRSCL